MRAAYAASLAAVAVTGYVTGAGDRHLDNFLLAERSGALVPIDFGCAPALSKEHMSRGKGEAHWLGSFGAMPMRRGCFLLFLEAEQILLLLGVQEGAPLLCVCISRAFMTGSAHADSVLQQ